MISKPHVDWFAISPELVLLGVSALALFVAVLVPRWARKALAAFVCAGGFLGAFVAAAILYGRSADGHPVVSDAMARDRLAALAQLIVFGSALVVVLVSWGERFGREHVGEYYALLATAASGMAFFVSANNLMTLFLGLEWFSIALYVLTAIDIDLLGSLEAGLKYLVVGSFGSAVLHEARGSVVSDAALDLRPAEIAVLAPLVACLLALSVWPAGITDRLFSQGQSTPSVTDILR